MSVLAGKIAVVTGAARGIGQSIAQALAEAGADVAINDIAEPAHAAASLEAVAKNGRRGMYLRGDVTDQAAVEAMFDQVLQEWGHVDVVVCNAVFADRDLFHVADMAGFHRTIDVTMWGAFYTLRAAAGRMVERGKGGSIVAIGSRHAVTAVPTAMAYNMAKAAIDQMVRTAAIELAEHRIRVNVVHPGWIDTPGERKFASDEQIEKAGKRLPWGRLGRPDEIARGVVFLCDPASDYVTGSTLMIDGGSSLPWWAARGSAVPD